MEVLEGGFDHHVDLPTPELVLDHPNDFIFLLLVGDLFLREAIEVVHLVEHFRLQLLLVAHAVVVLVQHGELEVPKKDCQLGEEGVVDFAAVLADLLDGFDHLAQFLNYLSTYHLPHVEDDVTGAEHGQALDEQVHLTRAFGAVQPLTVDDELVVVLLLEEVDPDALGAGVHCRAHFEGLIVAEDAVEEE